MLGKRCRFEMMKKADKDKDIIVVQKINEKEVPQMLLQEELEMKYQGITIHKNKTCDTWYTRYRVGGKQYYISARTQKECLEKLKKALYNKKRDYFMSQKEETHNKSITLLEWYQKWLELYKIGKVKETTIKDYEKTLKLIHANILNKRVRDIKIIEVLENLNNIKAERQRQKAYEFLYMIFEKARINDYVEKNIMANIDKPKHKKKNSQPLTKEVEQRLIEACDKVLHGDYLLVCLYQGLRKGECLAITTDDVNFENNTISINKSINDRNQFDTTKNEQSNRIIPMFDRTKQILLRYKDKQGRIFNFGSKILQKALREINTRIAYHLKIKDLRSTFITRCQEMNIPEFIIQSWVGHTIGSKVTKSVYTKYNAQDNTKYINIFNNTEFYSNSTH